MIQKKRNTPTPPLSVPKNKDGVQAHWYPGVILGLLAFILYANTLSHGFVLDDSLVITKNQFTTQGLAGWSKIFTTDTFFGYFQIPGKETIITGGRYRPLSLALFALIYQIFGAKAFVFHLFNVLLYALSAILLFKTLHALFHKSQQASWFSLAFLSTLLFVAHPVHTEVVNNIKCADEILSLLLSILTLKFTLKAYDTEEKRWAWWAGLAFLGACFSKENAITFLAAIPMAIYFFRPKNSSASSIPVTTLLFPAIIAFVLFFVARGTVLHWKFGEEANVLINNPFIKWDGAKWLPFTFGERSAAIVYSLGEYLRLLVFPHPLTHDYYPRQIGIVSWADWQVWLSAVAGAGIIAGAFTGLKQKHIISFALLYYIITISIVSNVFFPIGTNLSERFIYMPSLAFGLIVGYYILKINNNSIKLALIGLLLTAYTAKTVIRNQVWKDNLTLASTDIAVSGNSAKLNNSYAAQLSEKALKASSPQEKAALTNQAINYYNKAITINPNYVEAFYGRGSAYFIRQQFPAALSDYQMAEKTAPDFPNLQNNLVLTLRESAKILLQNPDNKPLAVQYLREAQRRFPNDPEINGLLQTYGQ